MKRCRSISALLFCCSIGGADVLDTCQKHGLSGIVGVDCRSLGNTAIKSMVPAHPVFIDSFQTRLPANPVLAYKEAYDFIMPTPVQVWRSKPKPVAPKVRTASRQLREGAPLHRGVYLMRVMVDNRALYRKAFVSIVQA